jgi:hypothetical protein
LGIAIDLIGDACACISLAKEKNDNSWLDRLDFDPNKIDEWIDERAAKCEQWLQEEHCGDCTCVPMSCLKCYAEEMLGFSVRAGLGKYEGHAIERAFLNNDVTELDVVIDRLANDPITASWGEPKDWEPHMQRWRHERDQAVVWLRKYRDEHFPAK